jgi:hypothetical protein
LDKYNLKRHEVKILFFKSSYPSQIVLELYFVTHFYLKKVDVGDFKYKKATVTTCFWWHFLYPALAQVIVDLHCLGQYRPAATPPSACPLPPSWRTKQSIYCAL